MIDKMLIRFDLFLWNFFVPKLTTDFFKKKFNTLLVVVYVSMYQMPRKFLIHYFRGKAKPIVVDSRKLISSNPSVMRIVTDYLQPEIGKRNASGSFNVAQTNVDNPNYRYAVGSFRVNYSIKNEIVTINIRSSYRFQESPDRITKYLHRWFHSFKKNQKANDFKIFGTDWITDINKLMLLKAEKLNEITRRFQVLV